MQYSLRSLFAHLGIPGSVSILILSIVIVLVELRCFLDMFQFLSVSLTRPQVTHALTYPKWSFRTYESSTSQHVSPALLPRITSWLINTDLFEQAWATVCTGAFNWWWSEQLCIFTVGFWTVFLYIKGRFTYDSFFKTFLTPKYRQRVLSPAQC